MSSLTEFDVTEFIALCEPERQVAWSDKYRIIVCKKHSDEPYDGEIQDNFKEHLPGPEYRCQYGEALVDMAKEISAKRDYHTRRMVSNLREREQKRLDMLRKGGGSVITAAHNQAMIVKGIIMVADLLDTEFVSELRQKIAEGTATSEELSEDPHG